MTIVGADLFEYSVPLRAPLVLDNRILTTRRGLLLRLVGGDDAVGWGDAAPLPGFSTEDLLEARHQARPLVVSLRDVEIPDVWDPTALRTIVGDTCASVAFAAETAVAELLGRSQGRSVLDVLGGGASRCQINALISDEDDLDRSVDRCLRQGYSTVKLKVGRRTIEADAARVRGLSRRANGALALRLDANRAWTMEEATAFAEAIGTVPIDYVEEPLRTPERLPELVSKTGLPVAIDETTREAAPDFLEEMPFVRAVVLKPSLLGGAIPTLRWAQAARRVEAAPVISASYESGVGLRMLAALAATMTDEAAGVSTHDRLETDVLTPRISFDRPTVDVERLYRSSVDETTIRLVDSQT